MLLVLVEDDSGAVSGGSQEALTLAHGLATDLNVPVHAAAFGTRGEFAATLGAYGVSTLHLLEGPFADAYSPECWGAALAELVRHIGAIGVIAAASEWGNEVLAHASARTGEAFASNCVTVDAGQQWSLTRVRGGGMLLEDAELAGAVKFVSLTPGAVEPAELPIPQQITTDSFVPESTDTLVHSTIVDRKSRGAGVALSTARVVVSGGRGVGSAEGFESLEELAELLGGAVGCSRVATNSGWRPHSDQVGLTGTKIAADLYIACGISGATQHWVGCMGAKSILAINTDPEAPLVTRADYAVIGDVHQVLPAILERARARKQVQGVA
ncbi:electron transfer flavoprotein alpha subunit apoprotein [Halopolyspora algeriensis]|uniref:Electron transfer flavoprotein alpha subunit apoprotein n=1 Tax=Halopolyspora algeriensis TaxID=1500506 RepID=A0A368VK65_9ACTN|nr:electron transfer flavoprotein subunit alpha/FixB family protein [Halopolyspora algeriensis]RCW40939.1 electron transfer flavoprotein alpha subunit apoprotein [Halopolyspora algeriensis]TQM53975.1 electron transfer flavoprotein alpha subunit apoprotein [Halopolyspora algeriensis]